MTKTPAPAAAPTDLSALALCLDAARTAYAHGELAALADDHVSRETCLNCGTHLTTWPGHDRPACPWCASLALDNRLTEARCATGDHEHTEDGTRCRWCELQLAPDAADLPDVLVEDSDLAVRALVRAYRHTAQLAGIHTEDETVEPDTFGNSVTITTFDNERLTITGTRGAVRYSLRGRELATVPYGTPVEVMAAVAMAVLDTLS